MHRHLTNAMSADCSVAILWPLSCSILHWGGRECVPQRQAVIGDVLFPRHCSRGPSFHRALLKAEPALSFKGLASKMGAWFQTSCSWCLTTIRIVPRVGHLQIMAR